MLALTRRVVVAGLISSFCVLFLPPELHAHAVLVDSTPVAGSTVHGPDLSLRLRFNVRVDGSRSRCTLISPDGGTTVLALDSQSKPDILTSQANRLGAGQYKLQWQVLAADGHISRGELTFNVA
jgi:copper resistance protein C